VPCNSVLHATPSSDTGLRCELPPGTGLMVPLIVARSQRSSNLFYAVSYLAPVIERISSDDCLQDSDSSIMLRACNSSGSVALTIEGVCVCMCSVLGFFLFPSIGMVCRYCLFAVWLSTQNIRYRH